MTLYAHGYNAGFTSGVICMVFDDLLAFEAWWRGYTDGLADRALPVPQRRRHEIEVAAAMAGRS